MKKPPEIPIFKLIQTIMISAVFVGSFIACAGMQIPGADSPEPVAKKETASHFENGGFIPDGYFEPIPPLGEKGYILTPLAQNIYFFSAGAYNTMFVVTPDGTLLIDPIRGKGDLIKKALKETSALPVKNLIYSHSHLDHIGDAHLFSKNVQIIAHKETSKLLELYKDPNRPVPHISFGKNFSLDFGGEKIDLIYPGEGHGKGNIIIHLPQKRILMFVDVATPRAVPFKNFATVDIFHQIRGIERALDLDFDLYVGGHLFRPGKKEEMSEVLKYYYASKRANAEALKRVKFQAVRKASKTKDIERLFGEYYDAVAEECYRILKNDWKQRLMGFEAFARGHCDVWTSFHRTQVAP